MKTHFIIALAICLPVYAAMAQVSNHPSIKKMEVSYSPVASANTSSPEISVKWTAAITLQTGFNAAKIILTVKDEQTLAVIYQVNYTIASADVMNNGIVLYKKDGDTLYITNPASIPLKPYIYELYTEDVSETKSIIYSITQ
jgi:hypothetical protein